MRTLFKTRKKEAEAAAEKAEKAAEAEAKNMFKAGLKRRNSSYSAKTRAKSNTNAVGAITIADRELVAMTKKLGAAKKSYFEAAKEAVRSGLLRAASGEKQPSKAHTPAPDASDWNVGLFTSPGDESQPIAPRTAGRQQSDYEGCGDDDDDSYV